MALSDYLRNELVDHVFVPSAYTAPTNIYVKLHTGDPTRNGTANAAGNTTRQEATFTGPSASGVITNDAEISWTSVSTTEDYTHASLWDNSTAGNCLGSGTITANAVTAGDTFTIDIGDLSVTLD